MSLDRSVADRRRFAQLLGTHDELGSGLPISGGRESTGDDEPADGRGDD